MPRSSRLNNAQNNKQKYNTQLQLSPRPSPPTQLPTPLPEEDRVSSGSSSTMQVADDQLIDFDTPTPPPLQPIHFPSTLDIDPLNLQDEQDDVLIHAYRSPPFREAHLPDLEPIKAHSPPPLPVPPRHYHDQPNSHGDSSGGHTRWPTYSSSNTPSSSRSTTNSPFTIPYPSSLPNIHTRSPSRHSPSRQSTTSSQSPSTFHSLTRTLRSYVPSSIHIPIPSAAPSPPLVSRPVSFGRFSSDSRTDTINSGLGLGFGDATRGRKVVSRQEFERDYEREGEEEEYYAYGGHGYSYGYGQGHEQQQQSSTSGLARAMNQNRSPAPERAGGINVIEWAKWDVLGDRRFLILAYPAGLQIWDCSDLSAISEGLNLNFDSAEWRMILGNGKGGSTKRQEEGMVVQVIHAALLPAPRETPLDLFGGDRPLLGILMQMEHTEDEGYDSSFVLYSLQNHHLVKRLALSGLFSTFTANDQFIVVSMVSPPTLLVLSSTTFQTLYIIPSTSLEAFSPLPRHTTNTAASSSSSTTLGPQSSPSTSLSTAQSPISVPLSIDNISLDKSGNHHRRRYLDETHPVFALSHRLLAYASPSPSSSSPLSSANKRLSSNSSTASNPNSSLSSSPSPFGLGGSIGMVGKMTNMSQAELGQAALKVGETVLGGMKLLGGMAYDAARSRVSGGGGDVGKVDRAGEGGGRFLSTSAPDTVPEGDEDAAQSLRERRFSNNSPISGYHVNTVTPFTKSALTGGYYITVVDLSPLLVSTGKTKTEVARNVVSPTKIDEFMSSRSHPISALQFSGDGTSLAVIQGDGYVVKTFKIRPIPSVVLSSGIFSGSSKMDNSDAEIRKRWSGQFHEQTSNAVQMYTLRRGRTSAVIDGADWSKDGRWLAIGTRKRTVHVFPVNPYGGKVDIASHLEGRVRNVDVISHPLTELSPLIRLRGTKQSSAFDYPTAPLAFTFISALDIAQSPRLLPQRSLHSKTPSSPTISSHQIPKQHQQFQDVLLFDPADGFLSLRRLSLDKHFVREQGLGMAAAAASVQALGVTSISLPGMGGAGRLAAVGSLSSSGNRSSAIVDHPAVEELVAKESIVATWHLQRRMGWVEIKGRIVYPDVNPHSRLLGGDWLAEAELSTCSNSRHILPRSIYLSHQFSFHTLGEDYHALIRRHQFDICGEEIKVRKQVEITAYSSGGPGNTAAAAAFVEGFSAPRDIRRNISSSFDEPIASAISGSFDNSNLPAILPMYPNGIPGGKPKSFRNSIPIRTMAAGIGDGVSEGLGRIRREMHKVRSPLLLPRSDNSLPGSVPLEFDEDFLVRDVQNDDGNLPVRGATLSTSRDTSREGGGTSAESLSSLGGGLDTPADANILHQSSYHHYLPLVDDDNVVGAVDEEIWSSSAWDQQDALAIDEAEQFDNIATVGYLDDEQARPAAAATAATTVMPVLNSKRKGRQKRK